MFFIVAGFLFVLFFWVTFLKGVEVEAVLVSSAVTSDGDELSEQSYEVSEQDFEVLFDEIDVMRLVDGSSFEIEEILEEEGFYTVSVELEKGGLWVSNMGGVLSLMAKSGDFMIQNVDGYYYIGKEGDVSYVYAFKHPVRVHFLDEEGNSVNSYLIPEGYYAGLDDGFDSGVISDLRYAKLVKEYPFYSLSDDDWNGVSEFVSEDDDRYRGLLSDFEAYVRQNYDSSSVENEKIGFLYDAVAFLRDYLTFSEVKKEQWAEQDTLTNLNEALYLSVKGDEEGAIEKLQDLEGESVVGEDYRLYLSYLNVVLNNSLYGDDLYPVKDYLRDLLYGSTDEGRLIILRQRLNEMYDLVSEGEVASAKEAFDEYERDWWDFLGMSADDLSEFRKDVSEEREILSVLLLKEDGFYETTYFDLLEEFEQAVFKVAVSGVDLDEERQAFVSGKLKVVNGIEALLAASGIDVDNATDLMVMLLDSAEVLVDEIESGAAILSYFEEEIEEGWLVVQFINSTLYSSLSGDFYENFNTFLEEEQDLEELKEYLQGLYLGIDEETDLSLSEAKEIVYEDFDGAGVSYTAVISIGDSAYRLFEIQGGEVDGVSFEANYDREGQLIYDLVVDEVSFTTGVSLSSLVEVVESLQLADSSLQQVDDEGEEEVAEDETSWSYSEELAISLLVDYLADFGLEVLESSVVEMDVDEDLFYLEGVEISGSQVDFTVWASEDLVTGIVVDGEEVEGEFSVVELEGLVE